MTTAYDHNSMAHLRRVNVTRNDYTERAYREVRNRDPETGDEFRRDVFTPKTPLAFAGHVPGGFELSFSVPITDGDSCYTLKSLFVT